jgi:hypothetical protein
MGAEGDSALANDVSGHHVDNKGLIIDWLCRNGLYVIGLLEWILSLSILLLHCTRLPLHISFVPCSFPLGPIIFLLVHYLLVVRGHRCWQLYSE